MHGRSERGSSPRTAASLSPAPARMAVDLSVSLDQLIATKLGSLSLRDDDDTVDFVRGLVEEDSFEPDVRRARFVTRASL